MVLFRGAAAESRQCSVSAEPPVPVALTLSGGVSLGAYQAGSLFYSSLVLRENPELFQMRLLTGASAGALNALFAVLSVCGTETKVPSESAFYKTWVEFKGQDLLASPGESEALFSRKAFEGIASELEVRWKRGLPVTCDVVLGLSITRLEPLKDLSKIGFSRVGEKVTLRISGQGAGRAPQITNYVNPSLFPKPLLLHLEPDQDQQNFEMLKQVLFASSAFPVAFAPQSLKTCVAQSSEPWAHLDLPFQCPKNEIQEAKFVDGGILDNKPLALAEKIARMGLVVDECGQSKWREIPISSIENKVGSSLLYLYSDLSATTYEVPKLPPVDPTAFNIAPMLVGSVFGASRNQDSSALIEQSPTLENQIAAPKNHIPRMGDSLLGFFGFFERDFRSFDFHLGLFETQKFFTESLKTGLRKGSLSIGETMKFPEFRLDSEDAKKQRCLGDVLLAEQDNSSVCRDVDDRGFVQLARLAGARLRAKRFDFGFMVDWLANEGYEYRDLKLSGSEAWRAPAKIKTEAIAAVATLAEAQSATDAFVLRTAGPLALNLIEPLPIERDFSIVLGPQTQFSISSLIEQSGMSRTRWSFGIGFENLSAWLGTEKGLVVATPMTAFEFEPFDLNSGYVQTRFSIGGGYKFKESNDGIAARVGVSLTLIERLRLQLDFEAMPFEKHGAMPWQILPGIGVQFYF